jgi:hypothetical protein
MVPHRRVGGLGNVILLRGGVAAGLLLVTAGLRAEPPAYLGLRINELIANNSTVEPANCLCKHVDMLEIYNPSIDQVDLRDPANLGRPLKLTDGTNVWEFGAGLKISPRGRFVVFCDKSECTDGDGDGLCDGGSAGCRTVCADRKYEAHSSFKLDNDGETITLLGPNDEVIDEVTYPPLAQDVSWGRSPDGADSFVFFAKTANGDATSFGQCNNPVVGLACAGGQNGPGTNVDPQVDLVDFSTNSPQSGEPVTVRAKVKDEKLPDPSDLVQVAVVYRLDGGPEEEPVPLTFLRIETDQLNLLQRWSLWEGQIPGQIEGTLVDFHLMAEDKDGGRSTSPDPLCDYPSGPCSKPLPAGCPRVCSVPYQYLVAPVYPGPLVVNEVVAENQSIKSDSSEVFACAPLSPDCHFDDFLELYNRSDQDQDLSGLVLAGKPFHAIEGWRFPAGSAIHPRQHLLIWVDGDGLRTQPPDPTNPLTQEFHTDFNIDGKSDEVYLFAPVSRADGRKAFRVLDGMRWGRPGEPIDERDTFVAVGEEWRFWKGNAGDPPVLPDPGTALTVAWTASGYPEGDPGWIRGATPVGYGTAGLNTTLQDMRGGYLTVFFRKRFTVPDQFFRDLGGGLTQVTVKRLYLDLGYDDGFRAYLNGKPAAARNLLRPGSASPALSEIDPAREVLDITHVKDSLLRGPSANVLAVEVHNGSLSSDDFLFQPRLFWGVEGLGDDESLSRIPDGNLEGRNLKLGKAYATPGETNRSSASQFQRGDAGTPSDGSVDISDAIAILGYLFLGSGTPPCLDAADVDDSGVIDIADPVNLLTFLFQGGVTPPAPGPVACGPDGSDDDLPDCVDPICN